MFLRKSWWFVLTNMESLFWFILFILSLFFYLMKLYLFQLDVASPDGFILHVDYYFLSCIFFFFFEKVLLLCFNLLYVVMFLFFGKIICSYWLARAFARALKLVYNKIEKLCSIVLIYYHDF